jgi:hypothetical protein
LIFTPENVYIFTQMSSLKTWLVVQILSLKSGLMFWTLKLSFDVEILTFLGLATVLAAFQK